MSKTHDVRDEALAARDETHEARDEAREAPDETHAAPDKARDEQSFYQAELDELLAFFARPNLTIAQAEELLSHVHDERPFLVERLLAWLENVWAVAPPPDALQAASSTNENDAGQPEDAVTHDVALVLLTYLADKSIVPRLRAMVRDTRASDEFKLKLISVIHDLEPQQDSQILLDHLRYPGKAMLQSHRKHLQRLASPLERSFWLELMVEDMSADARISFARSSAEVDDPAAVPVLVCMCYDPDEYVALAAIDAVERYKDARALDALRELGRHHPYERVRQEAQKAADRLSVRVPLSPQVEPAPVDPLVSSYLTTVDGAGEQAAVFVRSLSFPAQEALFSGAALPDGSPLPGGGFLRLVQVAFNDEVGIEQCFGLDVYADDLDELLAELGAQGLAPVQVPFDQALAQLSLACEWTWSAGQLLPLSFVAWREWIVGAEGATEGAQARSEPDTAREVAEISAPLRVQRLETCYELLYQDEFEDWDFDTPVVDELVADYVRLIEEQGEPLAPDVLRGLLRDGVQQIVHPMLRSRLRERLYRVAPLLRELYEGDEVWQWAVVAADALQADSPYPPHEHPLLLGLVGYSLQLALDRDLDWTIAL